jgi:hypothetical protein
MGGAGVGPVLTPISPSAGFLFHADHHLVGYDPCPLQTGCAPRPSRPRWRPREAGFSAQSEKGAAWRGTVPAPTACRPGPSTAGPGAFASAGTTTPRRRRSRDRPATVAGGARRGRRRRPPPPRGSLLAPQRAVDRLPAPAEHPRRLVQHRPRRQPPPGREHRRVLPGQGRARRAATSGSSRALATAWTSAASAAPSRRAAPRPPRPPSPVAAPPPRRRPALQPRTPRVTPPRRRPAPGDPPSRDQANRAGPDVLGDGRMGRVTAGGSRVRAAPPAVLGQRLTLPSGGPATSAKSCDALSSRALWHQNSLPVSSPSRTADAQRRA